MRPSPLRRHVHRLAAVGVVATALAVIVAGCPAESTPHDSEAPEPAGEDTSTNEERLIRALRTARDDVKRLRFAAEAQIANAESHADGLAKARRVYDGLHVTVRIPAQRDEATIRRVLQQAARKARLRLSQLTISPKSRETRALPEQVRPEDGFRYRPDDLREVLEVSVHAAPADIARIETLDRELASAEPKRFIELRAVRATPGGFEIVATAYRFVPVDPPRRRAELPSKDQLLDDPTVQKLLPDFRSRPAVRSQLDAIDHELEQVAELVPQVNRALEPIAQMELVVARTGVLQRAAARVQNRSTASIMQ